MTISGLTPGQRYYFAIKSQDEMDNTSGVSNSSSARAFPATTSAIVYLPIVVKNLRPYEPNNGVAQAYGPLQNGIVYRAYPEDQEDWYYFELPSTTDVTVEVTNFAGQQGKLMVYHEDDTQNPVPGGYWGSGGETMSVQPTDLQPGKYYIRVYTGGDTSMDTLYRLTWSYQEMLRSD
jgi:hypothetical protein